MPKTPHDAISTLILLGSVFLGAFILKRAGLELTATQKATLAGRRMDAVVIVGILGFAAAYYYAPAQPLWALLGTFACITVIASRLARHHSALDYTRTRKAFLIIGLGVQGFGFMAAIILRAIG
jgi:phosphatidylglycerophosphate synthase